MTTHAAPALPVEITANIIDKLATDNNLLLKCSIISKTWRSRALHHLFSKVSIYTERRLDSLAALLHDNGSLITHIRCLTISSIHLTISYLPPLWNVDSLRLLCLRFPCDSTLDESIGQIAATCPHVTQFLLRNSSFCPNHDMPMQLFASLPHLRRLYLEDNTDLPCEMRTGEYFPWVCKLNTLRLIRPSPTALNYFVDAWKSGNSTIENLNYYPIPPEDLPGHFNEYEYCDSLSALIRSITSLRNLKLTTDSMREMALILQTVKLVPHNCLKTITLSCCLGVDENTGSLLSLIHTIRVTSLDVDVITLSIRRVLMTDPWDLDFDALSTLCSADETAVKFVLEIDRRVFKVVSLASFEQALGVVV